MKIEIDGIKYEIIDLLTPDGARRNNWPNLAREMEALGNRAIVGLKRPNGKRIYQTVQRKNGEYATPYMVA